MILATDVYYHENMTATAAGVTFADWASDEARGEYTTAVNNVAEYEPGNFYKRELPCLLALIESLNHQGITPEVIIVDGFVHLGEDQRPGLGAHLYKALGGHTPVIGVAKTGFAGTPEQCGVLRGKSVKPLFVTSIGIDLSTAKNLVGSMHGEHRLPTLLTRVDQLCRGIHISGVEFNP